MSTDYDFTPMPDKGESDVFSEDFEFDGNEPEPFTPDNIGPGIYMMLITSALRADVGSNSTPCVHVAMSTFRDEDIQRHVETFWLTPPKPGKKPWNEPRLKSLGFSAGMRGKPDWPKFAGCVIMVCIKHETNNQGVTNAVFDPFHPGYYHGMSPVQDESIRNSFIRRMKDAGEYPEESIPF